MSALLIVVGLGVLHGLWTDRWVLSAEPEASAGKLAHVAKNLGDWESQDLKLDAAEQAAAGMVGSLARNYVNRRTKRQVQVFLFCGRPGPIAVHTPDVCYQGAGYQMGSQTKYPTASAEFWWAKFVKNGPDVSDTLRIFWSWNADGRWQAPDYPRLVFAGQPALFKLYLVHHLTRPDETVDNDPSVELMQLLLPELEKCLFPKSS